MPKSFDLTYIARDGSIRCAGCSHHVHANKDCHAPMLLGGTCSCPYDSKGEAERRWPIRTS